MQERYNAADIEKKWQDHWDETKAYAAKEESTAEKYYVITSYSIHYTKLYDLKEPG